MFFEATLFLTNQHLKIELRYLKFRIVWENILTNRIKKGSKDESRDERVKSFARRVRARHSSELCRGNNSLAERTFRPDNPSRSKVIKAHQDEALFVCIQRK